MRYEILEERQRREAMLKQYEGQRGKSSASELVLVSDEMKMNEDQIMLTEDIEDERLHIHQNLRMGISTIEKWQSKDATSDWELRRALRSRVETRRAKEPGTAKEKSLQFRDRSDGRVRLKLQLKEKGSKEDLDGPYFVEIYDHTIDEKGEVQSNAIAENLRYYLPSDKDNHDRPLREYPGAQIEIRYHENWFPAIYETTFVEARQLISDLLELVE